jgi:hypothetical protein
VTETDFLKRPPANREYAMSDKPEEQISTERRTKPRKPADEYHSVSFQPKVPGPLYQFKIWNISDQGLCILVKKDFDVLNYLQVGDVMDMTYYPKKPGGTIDPIKTKIAHITPKDTGKFEGHLLVGLSLITPSPLP